MDESVIWETITINQIALSEAKYYMNCCTISAIFPKMLSRPLRRDCNVSILCCEYVILFFFFFYQLLCQLMCSGSKHEEHGQAVSPQ